MSTVSDQSPLEWLRRQLVGSQARPTDRSIFPTPFASLNALLPHRGLPSGSLIEWVSDTAGLRTTTIALKCAVPFLTKPGALAVLDPRHEFHAMSVSHIGIPHSRLLLIRPEHGDPASRSIHSALSQTQRSEALWALEQTARNTGVRLVLTWIDRISSTAQRRLQLAVENSGVTIFLIRPVQALRQTSWADLRFHVQAAEVPDEKKADRRMTVRLVRSKNAVQHHGAALLECDHETGDVSEVPELACSAATAKASR